MSALSQILNNFQNNSKTAREKGTYFEDLIQVFLQNDAVYKSWFSEVYTYAEWAKLKEMDQTDIGIDLVAKNVADEFYTAIQCKFYNENSTIDKKGLDSFIASSDNEEFNRRIFVDTTQNGLTDNLEKQINQSQKQYNRISLDALENSSIDWQVYLDKQEVKAKSKKKVRPHQEEAIQAIKAGLSSMDRGKMIMACGTGKTFTALKIAEEIAGEGALVLFAVPSLALISQTIREWNIDSDLNLNCFAVCSDDKVGKRKKNNDEELSYNIHDLAYPATTDARKLANKYRLRDDKMTVVFTTYHSIDVISAAQKEYSFPEFDLIICDEAHRTTGVTLKNDDESNFTKIHSNDNVRGKKRLYMTATPRVYINQVKEKAKKTDAILASMDDETIFGKELYVLPFGDAVQQDLLTDYKVIILTLDDQIVAQDIQNRLKEADGLTLDDATKMIGCYKALASFGKKFLKKDEKPMQRVVAFCRQIKDSKLLQDEFPKVIEEYLSNNKKLFDNKDINFIEGDNYPLLKCETDHVDGKMNSAQRESKLRWLKEDLEDENICRMLSNARCLSEGVDVPSLDAVMFVHSRKSKTDIVQSVGRVMRKSPEKKMGYIILPIVVSAQEIPEKVLNDNKKYSIVWDVLNALRSHDESLDADINKASVGEPSKKMEIISYVDVINPSNKAEGLEIGGADNQASDDVESLSSAQMQLEFDSVQQAILAKMVEKCGTRTYWEDWAKDVSQIAEKHIKRIKYIIEDKESEGYKAFKEFLDNLHKNINEFLHEDEVIEMLAQHMITKPVFEALFNDYEFTKQNPISQSIQKLVEILEGNKVSNEAKSLDKFYASIKNRVAGIDTTDGKQKIIIELYDKFFQNAFPKMSKRLGIVYTPVECVDFIIHSVNDILKEEFGQSLGDKNIHIIDPFTGTGTFITRLLQSGLITKDQLEYKYKNEIHANEIVLLAYYIAAINIETRYHEIMGNQGYNEFEGICLTDSFQLYENEEKDLLTPKLEVNNKRRKKQKSLDIKVIIGNPPYSAGQKSGNDNNQNITYKKLDASIKESYVKHSNAQKGNYYDSYIRAIRWASNRIGDKGVIGFITNAGFIEAGSADGLRKCLKDEFTSLYIFHLRGHQRTEGELSRKEGGQIFGAGSRAPIAITIFVKNPEAEEQGKIYMHDIGDYLKREEKLKIIKGFKSIKNITEGNKWQEIIPDQYNDWLKQRDDSYYDLIPMGSKDKKSAGKVAIFDNYSNGVKTNRDAWVYNSSKEKLESNIRSTIAFYNQEREKYHASEAKTKQPKKLEDAERYLQKHLNNDSTKIAFSVDLRKKILNNQELEYKNQDIIISLYRPFTKQFFYYHKSLNERVNQLPKIFPETGLDNLVIGISGVGANQFSCLISDCVTELHGLSWANQCFPLYLYELIDETHNSADSWLDNKPTNEIITAASGIITAPSGNKYKKNDGITDDGLKHFTEHYKDTSITKEDLFYYIYALLHNADYRNEYADSLTKDLARIPQVETIELFKEFTEIGRELASLHINYETIEAYPVELKENNIQDLQDRDFYVTKMKLSKDKSTIVYSDAITIINIPERAYDYIINGKSAIKWVLERQGISTHKNSGIINNANDYAQEAMDNPRYPFDLLCKIINLSLKTLDIIDNIPNYNMNS